MDVVICGAGEVGRHAAEVLGTGGNNITLIDKKQAKLAEVEDVMDVRVLKGNCTHAEVLKEAGCGSADLFVAATNVDEINLLSASLAKGLGARQVIARVHHSAYFEQRGLSYAHYLNIDHLICPEHTTAVAIAQTLRTPGALAIESLGHGKIEMHQIPVSEDAQAIGKPLMALKLPSATRIASVERRGTSFIPTGETTIEADDIVTLIGDIAAFGKASKQFDPTAGKRKRVMILGGTPMGVWLCRALRSRSFSVRLFVRERERAEELAAKLDWVTVVRSDLMDPSEFEDERVEQVDAFVALTPDDENNILAAALAKSMGARSAIAVLQRSTYLNLLAHVGIDRAFSPRVTAVSQLQQFISEEPVRQLATLAPGIADLYELRVPTANANTVVGKPLHEIRFPGRSIVAIIERGDEVRVPGGEDAIQPGDTLAIIGPPGIGRQLRKMFSI